jgi:hypothetical protein
MYDYYAAYMHKNMAIIVNRDKHRTVSNDKDMPINFIKQNWLKLRYTGDMMMTGNQYLQLGPFNVKPLAHHTLNFNIGHCTIKIKLEHKTFGSPSILLVRLLEWQANGCSWCGLVDIRTH